MQYDYKRKMMEFGIESESDYGELNPGWVSKMKNFEDQIAKKLLTDEQIQQMDLELAKDFDELHNVEEVDSEEVIQIKRENHLLQIKQQISQIDDENQLVALEEQYAKEPDVLEYIVKRKELIKKHIENAKTKVETEAETQKKQQQEGIIKRLRSQKMWTYDQLRQLGIVPTGEDMTIAGVKLTRQYLFKEYKIEN